MITLTADDSARVGVDLSESEASLFRRVAETISDTGPAYSGRLAIERRDGGGADPNCSTCSGSGRPFYYLDGEDGEPCSCIPTAVVDREPVVKPAGLDALIVALQIVRTYGNVESPTQCHHDELRLVRPEGITPEDLATLDDLGFADDGDVLTSFWFGS